MPATSAQPPSVFANRDFRLLAGARFLTGLGYQMQAVVAGGVATILVAAAWAWLFPALRTRDRLQIESGYVATEDIELLFDARSNLKLPAPDVASSGVIGLLRKLDQSFEIVGRQGFRAANRDGYLVDLIMPAAKDRMAVPPRSHIGSDVTDLHAVGIEGLSWLVNSPKVSRTVIDVRGYPLDMRVPDPRAFAPHKAWLSERTDRDPRKRHRDRAQAELVAAPVARHLPHLRFEDSVLGALPAVLRAQAAKLLPPEEAAPRRNLEPDWWPGSRGPPQRPPSSGDQVGSEA